ncbi:IucA/IucC family siderophore biosynthesis protein [Paenibacillus sp. IB182496]|uniref:IucA/IucC family siderophore biosynthesis protein n=1 Tax=Paenibacillus sabuli TaxID=2772509 RepID=A0A927GV80_9BACL|nr:IucA/IucC family protein [Paenibacillus sabuli]MBD2848477.1 IucA/IucC family siderophore biosynthesis protein [Paenibacillus sabuli]
MMESEIEPGAATAAAADVGRLVGMPAYTEARRRVFRQLLEALLYEQMVACSRRETAEDEWEIVIEGAHEAGRAVRYMCRAQAKLTFGKLRLTGDPVLRTYDGHTAEAADLALFLQEIAGALVEEPRHLTRFARELEQTLLKDASARAHRQCAPVRGARTVEELEGDVLGAHPYHPCYKSRIGFSLQDNMRYGPEFHPRLRLLWLAVHRDDVRLACSPRTDWKAHLARELGEPVLERFLRRLAAEGRDPESYVPLPVHPWQWTHRVAPLYHRFLADGRIAVLGEGDDAYMPQQSLRTLSNVSHPAKDQVKTALGIVNTSAVRILGTHHVTNGPILSDWLAEVVSGDPVLHGELGLVVLREHAGVSYRYDRLPEPLRAAGYGALGAIWRESVHGHLRAGETAVPFTALCHVGADGTPYIDRWVRAQGVESWLELLLAASMRPLLRLLLGHGIAMESHGQNLLLLLREERPARLALRDLPGGVRFYTRDGRERPLLRGLLDSDPLHPNSYSTSPMETDNVDKIRNFLMDSFFQIMLADLCQLLETHYGLSERAFWRAAAAQARSCVAAYGAAGAARYDLFAETIEVGQLTRRRLFGEQVVRNHAVPNPLHEAEREQGRTQA